MKKITIRGINLAETVINAMMTKNPELTVKRLATMGIDLESLVNGVVVDIESYDKVRALDYVKTHSRKSAIEVIDIHVEEDHVRIIYLYKGESNEKECKDYIYADADELPFVQFITI